MAGLARVREKAKLCSPGPPGLGGLDSPAGHQAGGVSLAAAADLPIPGSRGSESFRGPKRVGGCGGLWNNPVSRLHPGQFQDFPLDPKGVSRSYRGRLLIFTNRAPVTLSCLRLLPRQAAEWQSPYGNTGWRPFLVPVTSCARPTEAQAGRPDLPSWRHQACPDSGSFMSTFRGKDFVFFKGPLQILLSSSV